MKRLLGVVLAASLPVIACAPAPNAAIGPSQEKMQVKVWRGPFVGLHSSFGYHRGIWGLGAPVFGLGYGAFGLPWLRGYGIAPWGLGWGLGAAAWPYPQGYAGLGLGTFAYGVGLRGLGFNLLMNNPVIPGIL